MSCWHCSIVILFYMFYFGLIVVMAVCWWYFLSDEHVCFLFAAFSVGLAYVTWVFLYLGMLVLCGYLLVIFGTCVCVLLELFALGHVSCVFTCASWILLSIPYIRGTVLCLFELVLWCFLLATTVLLERCFCYLCDVFVSTCFYLSMSKCKLQSVGLFHG